MASRSDNNKPTKINLSPAKILFDQTRIIASSPHKKIPKGFQELLQKDEMTQFDLFSTVFPSPHSTQEDMSHIIHEWDLIPLFGVSRRAQDALRTESGNLPLLKRKCRSLSGEIYELEITPAKIMYKNGTYKEFYPSSTEELVTDILRKISRDQTYGSHYPTRGNTQGKTACTFSISMIKAELKRQGHARSSAEIKEALTIMHRCFIEITKNGKSSYSEPLLPARSISNREQYLEDSTILSTVTFSSIINHAIDTLEYRQFRYDILTSLNNSIAKWVFRLLNVKYTNAGIGVAPFELKFSDAQEMSGLLDLGTTAKAVAELEKAIIALEKSKNVKGEHRVINSYTKVLKKDKKTILDAIFYLTPSNEFIEDMIAANSRNKIARTIPTIASK